MTDDERRDLSVRMATGLSNMGLLRDGYRDIAQSAALIEQFLKDNPQEPPDPAEVWKKG